MGHSFNDAYESCYYLLFIGKRIHLDGTVSELSDPSFTSTFRRILLMTAACHRTRYWRYSRSPLLKVGLR